MVHRELSIAVREVLDLLLLGHNLLIEQVNLLCRDRLFIALSLFARCGGFASNIVEGLFAVGAKFGVLELPCLCSGSEPRPNREFPGCDLHFVRTATGRFLRYSVAPCGNRICSAVARNWRSCYV